MDGLADIEFSSALRLNQKKHNNMERIDMHFLALPRDGKHLNLNVFTVPSLIHSVTTCMSE